MDERPRRGRFSQVENMMSKRYVPMLWLFAVAVPQVYGILFLYWKLRTRSFEGGLPGTYTTLCGMLVFVSALAGLLFSWVKPRPDAAVFRYGPILLLALMYAGLVYGGVYPVLLYDAVEAIPQAGLQQIATLIFLPQLTVLQGPFAQANLPPLPSPMNAWRAASFWMTSCLTKNLTPLPGMIPP